MASAMTGIAATLLPQGQTAHKTFNIPIPCLENSVCKISPSHPYAEELRNTSLFIIDEGSMLSKHAFEAIDRLFRDIVGVNAPFGGKIFLLGGDFRQTLPIVRRASPTVILENCIISSPLWNVVQRFKLTSNMRVNSNEAEFKSFLIDMGEGKLPLKRNQPFHDSIEIPSSFTTSNNIVDDIFPHNDMSHDSNHVIKRAILCPTNNDAISINGSVLSR